MLVHTELFVKSLSQLYLTLFGYYITLLLVILSKLSPIFPQLFPSWRVLSRCVPCLKKFPVLSVCTWRRNAAPFGDVSVIFHPCHNYRATILAASHLERTFVYYCQNHNSTSTQPQNNRTQFNKGWVLHDYRFVPRPTAHPTTHPTPTSKKLYFQ